MILLSIFCSTNHRAKRLQSAFLSALSVVLLCPISAVAAGQATKVLPLEAQSYQEDFRVSAKVAEQNLAIQQRGAGIVEILEHTQGRSYAGVWFDNERGEFVVPVLDGGRAVAKKALSNTNLEGSFRVEPVQYSWEELEAAHEQLDKALIPLIEEGLIQISLDPRTNGVVLEEAEGASKSDEEQLEESARQQPVKVEVRASSVERFEAKTHACKTTTPRGCDKPLRGGVAMSPPGGVYAGACSVGFKALGNGTGDRYILTAGHCAASISSWEAENSSGNFHPIGNVTQATFPGGDWAKINADGSYWDTSPWPTMVAHYWEDQERTITAEGRSYLGEYVCHSGSSTGTTCGNVLALDVTIAPGGSAIYHETKFGQDCGANGDSGGPAFSGHIAVGLYNAGESLGLDCPGTDNLVNLEYGYYVEITEATDALGVSVAPRQEGPAAETYSLSSLGPREATATGSVDPHGPEANFHFEYGPTTSYGSATQSWSAGSGWGSRSVSGTMTGLAAATYYHYRIAASNELGGSYGSDLQFTTPTAAPIATAEEQTDVKGGMATLHGTVEPGGLGTHYRFEWGTTEGNKFDHSAPVREDAYMGAGPGYIRVGQTIEGIKGLTGYHYRIYAYNSKGSYTSNVQSFATPDWRPTITTDSALHIEVSEEMGKATLYGHVNPNGFSTHYHFEWGTEAEYKEGKYGHLTPTEDVSIGSGESSVEVHQKAEGLQSEKTYHYRVVAENSEGKIVGADKSFTTPNWRPGLTIEAPTDIEGGKATLHGRVEAKGIETHYHFEWGTEAEYKEGKYGHLTPVPDADIGHSFLSASAEQEIKGIKGKNTYHYRLVAESAQGKTTGADESFTTSDWRPEIHDYLVSPSASPSRVTLEAAINPEDLDTHYHFEWGESTEYGHSTPFLAKDIGAGKNRFRVYRTLHGLKPHTTFHFKVVAVNDEGTSESEDETFTTENTGFASEGYPVILRGSTLSDLLVGVSGTYVDCSGGGYFEKTVQGPSTALTTSALANYHCSPSGETLDMKGCNFIFNPVPENESEATFAIGPAGCGPITLNLFGCPIHIRPQSGLHAYYYNEGSGNSRKARVLLQATGVKYDTCDHGKDEVPAEDGILEGEWVIKGVNPLSEGQKGLWLADELSFPSTPSTFNSTVSKAHFLGEENSLQEFIIDSNRLTCREVGVVEESVEFSKAEEDGTYASPTITVKPVYQGCESPTAGVKAYVEFGKCSYVFSADTNVDDQAPITISCPAGSQVHVKVTVLKLNCVEIPPQTLTGGVGYANVEAVKNETKEEEGFPAVELESNASGMEYTELGPCGSGKRTDGTYNGTVKVGTTSTIGNLVAFWWRP